MSHIPPNLFSISSISNGVLHIPWPLDGNEDHRNGAALLKAIDADDLDSFLTLVTDSDIDIAEYRLEGDKNCLHKAVELSSNRITAYLLTQLSRDSVNALVNSRSFPDGTPMTIACRAETENLELVHALLDGGADLDNPLALAAAAERGHIKIVESLLKVTAHEDRGMALHWAIRHGRTDMVKVLVNYEAIDFFHKTLGCVAKNVNMALNEGVYSYVLADALKRASRSGHLEIVQVLLRAGACQHRSNALDAAVKKGHVDIVQLLLKVGAREYGSNALEQAASKGCLSIVEDLLAVVLPQDDNLGPALIAAVEHNELVIAERILHYGDKSKLLANVFDWIAASPRKKAKAVTFLMDRGANPSLALAHVASNVGSLSQLLLLGATASQQLAAAAQSAATRSNDVCNVKEKILSDETATLALIQLGKNKKTLATELLVKENAALSTSTYSTFTHYNVEASYNNAKAALSNLALCGDSAGVRILAPLVKADAVVEQLAESGNIDAIRMLVSTGLAMPDGILERLVFERKFVAVKTLIQYGVSTSALLHTLSKSNGLSSIPVGVAMLMAAGADLSMFPSAVTAAHIALRIEQIKQEFLINSPVQKIDLLKRFADDMDLLGIAFRLSRFEDRLDAVTLIHNNNVLSDYLKQSISDTIIRACRLTSDEIEPLIATGQSEVVRTFAHPDVLAQTLIRHLKNGDEQAARAFIPDVTDGSAALAVAAQNGDKDLVVKLIDVGADRLEAMRLLLSNDQCEAAHRLIDCGVDINEALAHIVSVTRDLPGRHGVDELREIGATVFGEIDHEDSTDSEGEPYVLGW